MIVMCRSRGHFNFPISLCGYGLVLPHVHTDENEGANENDSYSGEGPGGSALLMYVHWTSKIAKNNS